VGPRSDVEDGSSGGHAVSTLTYAVKLNADARRAIALLSGPVVTRVVLLHSLPTRSAARCHPGNRTETPSQRAGCPRLRRHWLRLAVQ
jgi:hypothetical protein